MLRWIVFCACLSGFTVSGLTVTDGLAYEPALGRAFGPVRASDTLVPPSSLPDVNPDRLTLLSGSGPAVIELSEPVCEPDPGLPQTENDFLTQQRWARMPAFEIFEEPLPSPMALAPPPGCLAPFQAEPAAPPAAKRRYVRPAVSSTVTVSDEKPAKELSHLRLPMPLTDPAAMVVQLFEKLKTSEERALHAERRLEEARHELSSLRASASATSVEPAPSSEVILLEMRCFEINLGGLGEADIDLTGVCKQELSRIGLFALVANGAFDQDCSCAEASAGPSEEECACSRCTGCTECTIETTAEATQTCTKTSCSGTRGQFIEDAQAFEDLLGRLEEAGLVHNISRPRLMTRSGETARIMVGRQYVNPSAAEGGRTRETPHLRTAGTEVEAKPVAKADGRVQIELHAEWSSVDEQASRHSGHPVLDRRSVGTSLELPAGKTAVVAGLMRQEGATAATKEFVVLITPKVIVPVARNAAEEVRR